ncbi:unnamed protein product [Urochloa humidicola]
MRQPPMWPLLLLPFLLAAAANAASGGDTPPVPPPMTPWPDQYHAVLVANLTARGGRLEVFDIYYDWRRGGDVNRVREQLSDGEPQQAQNVVQWANGTAYQFDAASCRTYQFDTGLLPPDWKKARVDGFDCHVWSNHLFARYYEDVDTGRPVAWKFIGIDDERHVLSFEPGRVVEDSSMWQAPAYCFDGSNAAGGGDGKGSSMAHLVNSLAGAPAAAASFVQ